MYYCGIDVAKQSHMAVVINEAGEVVEAAFPVSNDRSGMDHLRTKLARYQEQLWVGVEATGHYWWGLYGQLSQQGCRVAVINPLQVRAFRKVDLRKRKTDRVDAYWMAQFLRFYQANLTAAQPVAQLVQLRELSRFRFRLVEEVSNCKRRILTVLDKVFPEYEHLFSDPFLSSSRRLLAEAVTPEEFAQLDLSEVTRYLEQASRGRFGQEKAQQILAAARQSVGVSFFNQVAQIEMRCLLEQIDLLEGHIQQIEAQLAELMDQLPTYITSIPGIGTVLGALLLGELGDVRRFDRLEQLVAFAGIDASVFQTGQFEGDQAHMSKRGSPFLRAGLWQAATTSLLHNTELRTYYDRKRKEGKSHGVALGAVCRKLLARIYVVLRDQRPYQVIA